MLSMKVIGSSGKAKSYYAEYAQENGEAVGEFFDQTCPYRFTGVDSQLTA
jgi:hypothetical protein